MPGGVGVCCRIAGVVGRVSAIAFHGEYIRITIPIGIECDPLVIRRPGRQLVLTWISGQFAQPSPVQVHQEDIIVAIPARAENDLTCRIALGRVILRRIETDVDWFQTVGSHRVNLLITIPIAGECQPFIGGHQPLDREPGRLKIVRWIYGQIFQFGAICANGIYLLVPIPVAGKGDELTIRRPARELVIRRIIRQVNLSRAIGVHQIYLVVAVTVAGVTYYASNP